MPPKHLRLRWLMLLALFSVLLAEQPRLYAQETEVVTTQSFVIFADPNLVGAASSAANSCAVTAALRWYNRLKRVKVLYGWQQCGESHTVEWRLDSVITASGTFTLTGETGEYEAYKQTWDQLQPGDLLTLHTWIDGAPQLDIVSQFQTSSPVWAQIQTRADAAGNCFKFTGHNDPWGVFTASDLVYKFELNTTDWETEWLAGPDQPTVNWHVAFYYDEALTRLRSEYWFNNVVNPCYTPPPSPTAPATPTATETPTETPTPTATPSPPPTQTATPTGTGATGNPDPTDEEVTDEPARPVPQIFLPWVGV